MVEKACTRCDAIKPATLEFWYKGGGLDGLGYYCKTCACMVSKKWKADNHERFLETHREYNRTHSRAHEKRDRSDWRQNAITSAKNRSREMDLPYDLDIAFIDERMSLQSGRCYYTGIILDTTKRHRNPLGPSLDRVDSKRGYTKDNVVICCLWTNLGKSDTDAGEFQSLLTRIDLGTRPTR